MPLNVVKAVVEPIAILSGQRVMLPDETNARLGWCPTPADW
jgi:hypothetical protein